MLPFLSPRSPLSHLNVELVSWYITKSRFRVVHNIELGGGETKFVLSMFNNFVQLAGMVSRVLSKIVWNTLILIVHDNSIFFNFLPLQ